MTLQIYYYETVTSCYAVFCDDLALPKAFEAARFPRYTVFFLFPRTVQLEDLLNKYNLDKT